MKNIKRIAFLMAMLLLLPVVASCGSDDTTSGTTNSETSKDVSDTVSDVSSEGSGSLDISEDLNGNLKNSIAASDKNGSAYGKNVIMIQLNSLSVPIMDADSGKVTPYLNALKEDGIYFTNFFNQATDKEDIEYSALNSLLSPLGFSLKDTRSKFNSLATVLKKSGYSTYAFAGDNVSSDAREKMFQNYDFDKVSTKGISDAEIYAQAISAIKGSSEKGFYFISNIDSCYPYISETKSEINIDGASYLTDYANASARADLALKDFIEQLKTTGIYENTIVVIYGSSPMLDYTYEEIEKKCDSFLKDGIDTAKAHNVPMFILGLEKSEYKDLATVYDVYPTVLALTGADSKGILVLGENLFAQSDRSEKIFPIQGTLARGAYISDKVSYLRYTKTSVKCFDRVTGEEYKAIDYKDGDTWAKRSANECEYALKYNYFGNMSAIGEEETLKKLYETMPSTGKLTVLNETSNKAPTAKTALMSFNTQFYYAYDIVNGLSGLKLLGRKLVIEDGLKEGTYISPVIDAGEFEVLYTGWDIVYNGGSAEIYVSASTPAGASTGWLQVAKISENVLNCTPYEDDFVKVDSSRIYIKNGKSNGKVRVKIKLIAAEDGKTPALEYFTFTTDSVKVFNSATADVVRAQKAELKVQHVQAMAAKQSGAAAVACLVSSMTGKKPDITGVSAAIYDQASDSYTNLAAICEYVHSLKIDAFIDILNYEGVARVLEKNQQVLCYFEDTKSFSIIYGFEGKRKNITYYVYDILTGKDYTVTAAEFANTWNGVSVIMNTYAENIVPQREYDGKSSIMPECPDRPGITSEKKVIIIHNTGNYSEGALASNHVLYKLNNTNTKTSWHFTVDHLGTFQHLPTDETAWHASDGPEGLGNKTGIGIEICVNGFPETDGSGALPENYTGAEYEAWEKQFFLAIENAAQLVAQLMVEYDLDMDCILQHNDTAPEKKNCPMQMRYSSAQKGFVREGDMWLEFMTMVELRYNRLLATKDKFDTVNVD